jgi:outer membrane protein assembly factor BamB
MVVTSERDGARAKRDAARRAARRRRNVFFTVLGVVTLVVVLIVANEGGGGSGRPTSSTPNAGGTSTSTTVPGSDPDLPSGPPAAESGTMPWQLAAPISREVVLPSPEPGKVVIAGGLSATGASDSGIYTLDVATGALAQVGSLATATHDAAGGLAGGQAVVAGGGDSTVRASTEVFPAAGGAANAGGTLPQPRADDSGVTIGSTFYVVGGYDGTSLDPQVLATTDGRSYRVVADLPVPVRYAAVAAAGGQIWVFGGLSAAGAPVDTVQVVDPASGKATIDGTLPIPLEGAAAAEIGGDVFVAGGETGSGSSAHPVAGVLELDLSTGRLLAAGRLQDPVAFGALAVAGGAGYLVGGETAGGTPTAAVQMIRPNGRFGTAGQPGAGSPYAGYQLLIADRGNDRLLLLDDTGRIVWSYPSAGRPAPPGGFYYPDDAFFADHGHEIVVNQEDNHTIVVLAYPSGKVLWMYGHPRQPGDTAGYLDNPDDAYVLPDGSISVADTVNCRVIVLSPDKRILHQIGSGPNFCNHEPPTELDSPNGDTPLADGNLLVSEINGSYIDEYTTSGQLVWSTKLSIVSYPSDPQPVGPDRYLVCDYALPGAFVEFDRSGKVLYRYAPQTGPGVLDKPSLAELLPSGAIMANDDYNDRMMAIDPATGALVWQYGVTGRAGTAPGLLSIPDGFDIVGPGGVTPTHTATG